MGAAFIFYRPLLFLFLVIFFPALGQQPVLTKVPPPEGVYWGGIMGIAQDPKGFIWLATQNGLYRYDGYRFVSYYHDPNNKNSLASNRTQALFVSESGIIWIGFYLNGLDRFDPQTGNFTHFTHRPEDPSSLTDNNVTAILEDRQGVLWVGTTNGLNRLNPESSSFTRYYHNPQDTTSLSHDSVMKLFEDRQGTLWVGTGSYWLSKSGKGGLNRFNPDNNTFTRYLHHPEKQNSLLNNDVGAIYEDSRGTFWVGTWGEGLHTMNRQKGTFTRHQYNPLHPDKLSRAPIIGDHKDGVTFVQEDITGAIWIGTFGSGISRFDPKTEKAVHLVGNNKTSNGVQDNDVLNVCSSKEGVLFFGTLSGQLYRTYPLRADFAYQPTGARVFGFVEDASGKVWTATEKGLKVYDQKEGESQQIILTGKIPSSLEKEAVRSILKDRKGTVWLGGQRGLWRHNSKSQSFTLYAHDPQDSTSISRGIVSAIHEGQDGYLWLGTENGLNRMDSKTGVFSRFQHDPNNPNSLSGLYVPLIREDKAGNLWVVVISGGLNRLERKTGTFKHYLALQNITSMQEDASGRLWVGSVDFGLFLYDPEKDDFVRHTDKSTGKPLFANVMGMEFDEEGNLWVSSLGGLAKLNQEGNLVATYGAGAGLNPEDFTYFATQKGRKGHLYIGALSGFYTFLPQKIKHNQNPPQIVLTDFRLFDEPVRPEAEGPLVAPLSKTEEIELTHDQNVFTLDFAGIHFTNPEQNRHFFMLENYDADWRQAESIPTASYYKVPPGRYRFRVKAASSEGVWVEKALSILIHPPWWQTWWAYSLYGILAIAFLYGLRQYTVKRERLKHELNLQRLEAEKMHEIDHLKSRFFANISHEFRTPLTLILGPLEKFIARSSDEHQDKPVYQMMHRNARRLLELINQLLDLSKLEAGSMKLETKPADIVHFLKAIGLSFTSLAERRKIQYLFQYPHEHQVVYFDADKLEKIMVNLLSNAFKFTPAGGEVTVTARLNPAEEQGILSSLRKAGSSSGVIMLELKVRDSGTGIADDQKEKIFNRFYQADTSRTREQEGTGIGLSLVRELVDLHQGEIWVESLPGKGSCFTVRLPLVLADYEQITVGEHLIRNGHTPIATVIAAEEVMQENLEPVQNQAETDIPLVLIVEDNADIRQFIRQHLQPFYQITEAADGLAGHTTATETIPDLILSDVMMPKMDGVELCHKLKTNEKTAHIPVILLTAKASGEGKIEGLETGADDYIIKPFEAAELLVRIKNLIESRRKLREHFSRQITLEPASIAITSVDEQFLQRVMQIIEAHMSDTSFGVDAFGREVGMSRTQLYRKLHALTDQSPSEFIKTIRMKRAAALLLQQYGNIGEVAFAVGYNDPSYFTKCFREVFGQAPSEYVSNQLSKA